MQHPNATPDPAGFQDVYGLSCVENQVLLFLKEQGLDIRFFYGDSLVPLSVIAEDIVLKGTAYTEAGVVPRIQDRLRTAGILELTLHADPVSRIRERIAAMDDADMLLIQVTPDYARQVLHSHGWREDHFVRLLDGNGGMLLNDIPPLLRPLQADELEQAYAGLLLKARLLRTGQMKPVSSARLLHICAPLPVCTAQQLQDVDKPLARAQNLLLLYKVLRRRARAYAALFMDTGFMDGSLAAAEALQMKAAYQLLRGPAGARETTALLEELNEIEGGLIAALEERLP